MGSNPVMPHRLGIKLSLKGRIPAGRRLSLRHLHRSLVDPIPVKFCAAAQHCWVGRMGRRLPKNPWQGSRLGRIPVTQSSCALTGLPVRINRPRNIASIEQQLFPAISQEIYECFYCYMFLFLWVSVRVWVCVGFYRGVGWRDFGKGNDFVWIVSMWWWLFFRD